MIVLTRTDRQALELQLDLEGVQSIDDALTAVEAGQVAEVAALLDLRIPRKKGSPAMELSPLTIEFGEGTLDADEGGLCWRLEPDDIEYLRERLSQYRARGEFFPAELTHVQSGSRPWLDTVYLTSPNSSGRTQ